MALPARAYEACPNHPEVVSGLVACARCGVAYCSDCLVELEGKPYDAACKEEHVRDLRSGTVGLPIATAGRRFLAAFVDGLVTLVPIYFVIFYFFLSRQTPGEMTRPPSSAALGVGLAPIALPFLVQLLYEPLMLAYCGGRTLGKMALGIRVVRADGGAVRGGQAFGRALSRQLMNVTYVLGFVDALMVFSNQRRTLHDRAAGTLVVNAGS
jgi:uncharacterized RDD family membrane protein YckC